MLHELDCHRNSSYVPACVVGEPLADEEEDQDVLTRRGGISDQPRSSATKRRNRQLFKSPAKKVIFMPSCWFGPHDLM